MIGEKQDGHLTLHFDRSESVAMRHALRQIIRNYRIKPERMPADVVQVWYSAQGCQTAGQSAEETTDWIHNLHQIKKGRLRLLQRCLQQLLVSNEGMYQLKLATDQAMEFMVALNDHRLLLAARHKLGEAEMNLSSMLTLNKLKTRQRSALVSVFFLAWTIEEILSGVQGN